MLMGDKKEQVLRIDDSEIHIYLRNAIRRDQRYTLESLIGVNIEIASPELISQYKSLNRIKEKKIEIDFIEVNNNEKQEIQNEKEQNDRERNLLQYEQTIKANNIGNIIKQQNIDNKTNKLVISSNDSLLSFPPQQSQDISNNYNRSNINKIKEQNEFQNQNRYLIQSYQSNQPHNPSFPQQVQRHSHPNNSLQVYNATYTQYQKYQSKSTLTHPQQYNNNFNSQPHSRILSSINSPQQYYFSPNIIQQQTKTQKPSQNQLQFYSQLINNSPYLRQNQIQQQIQPMQQPPQFKYPIHSQQSFSITNQYPPQIPNQQLLSFNQIIPQQQPQILSYQSNSIHQTSSFDFNSSNIENYIDKIQANKKSINQLNDIKTVDEQNNEEIVNQVEIDLHQIEDSKDDQIQQQKSEINNQNDQKKDKIIILSEKLKRNNDEVKEEKIDINQIIHIPSINSIQQKQIEINNHFKYVNPIENNGTFNQSMINQSSLSKVEQNQQIIQNNDNLTPSYQINSTDNQTPSIQLSQQTKFSQFQSQSNIQSPITILDKDLQIQSLELPPSFSPFIPHSIHSPSNSFNSQFSSSLFITPTSSPSQFQYPSFYSTFLNDLI